MYTLVGAPMTRAFRVLWMLEELGLEYDLKPEMPHSDAVKAVNPAGKIPALIEGNTIITDSVAIIQYLADKHDGPTYAAGTLDRAQQDSLLHCINDEIDSALWTAARNTMFLPEEKRVPEIKDTLKWEFSRSIKSLEQRLGDGPYLMGEKFTVPDIVLAHCCGWARSAKFDLGDGPIRDYIRRVIARDAYQRADKIRAAG